MAQKSHASCGLAENSPSRTQGFWFCSRALPVRKTRCSSVAQARFLPDSDLAQRPRSKPEALCPDQFRSRSLFPAGRIDLSVVVPGYTVPGFAIADKGFPESVVRSSFSNIRAITATARKQWFLSDARGEEAKMPQTKAVEKPRPRGVLSNSRALRALVIDPALRHCYAAA